MANELFGHEKGAYTDAGEARAGLIEAANGGTLFLDEIAEMSLSMQIKLLRVIQEQEVQRLGSTKLIPVDVRFVAATNRDLRKEVATGRFRQDLFFRLDVVSLHLPPLAERRDDIPLLAYYFLKKIARRMDRQVENIDPKAMALLIDYDYPGNVRELENLIERAVMLTPGKVLLDDVIGELNREKSPIPLQLPLISSDFAESRDYILTLFEKQFVRDQLSRYDGNISGAGKASDMSRQNLHRLMVKHKIKAD